MDIPKTYDPKSVEDKWYLHWIEKKLFRSLPDDREPYTIVIPPPNVTGVLHMGHMLNNTIQDVLIRKARLEGKNACWVPGTDHASIATEAKVVAKLRKEGIKKSDLTRDEFMEHAWQWREKHGGIILEQLKRLGASCDWDRTRFTMEENMSKAVIRVFVDLYNKGYIYRGLKMINWDPEAKTTLSNEEVIHKEETSKLYFVKYKIEDSDEWLTIATTRPETILGDTAICVNPNDERYKHLRGKNAIVPMVERPVPVIFDDYVDMEFGTGALKVTPAHDTNDYELGTKHNLHVIDVLNEDGTMSEAARLYVGEDRFEVRKKIIRDFEEKGLLEKVEEINNKVGYSERTDVVVEPRLSLQWFVDMQKLVGPALDNVTNDNIEFFPSKFKNVYKHWMENIRDWPISRQLWWGQQIPAYYLDDGEVLVAETAEEALELAREKTGNSNLTLEDLRQEEDVVDTWFSSWLWPISVFDGFDDKYFDKERGKINISTNEDLNYYYPTNILVTAPEIIFFWVARMIMAGYEYLDETPFKDVYLHGIVRDMQRRKMSKSLGNSPDPLDLIDKYGADGVRVGMLLCSPAGNDLLFDEKLCEQGRNFCNKIWNAIRLLKGWEIEEGKNDANEPAILWFENKLNQTIEELGKSYSSYRLSEALMKIYNCIWDDFCAWYLEVIKPEYQKPMDKYTYDTTIEFLERLMLLIHPFMPFISEEIWHLLKDRSENEFIMVSRYPGLNSYDEAIISKGETAKEIVTNIRDVRNKNNIPPKELLSLYAVVEDKETYELFKNVIVKAGRLSKFEFTGKEVDNTQSFLIKSDKFFVETGIELDPAEEKEKLLQEIDYTKGFIKSVQAKLNNDRFVNNAPGAVVETERRKLQDGEARLKALEDSFTRLN